MRCGRTKLRCMAFRSTRGLLWLHICHRLERPRYTGNRYHANDKLAKLLEMSEKKLQRARLELVPAGFLRLPRDNGGGRGNKTVDYHLCSPAERMSVAGTKVDDGLKVDNGAHPYKEDCPQSLSPEVLSPTTSCDRETADKPSSDELVVAPAKKPEPPSTGANPLENEQVLAVAVDDVTELTRVVGPLLRPDDVLEEWCRHEILAPLRDGVYTLDQLVYVIRQRGWITR